jgi:predicted MPP superfamily phosphohydrolase
VPHRLAALGAAAVGAGAAGWGHFEAGWVRLETLACPLPGIPPELDGLRIAHLSDLHLGFPSRGSAAVERAVAWVEERRPDLTLISGDLLSRRSGEERLRSLLTRLPNCFAVLGNHDFALTRDPFSHPAEVFDLEPATLLLDDSRTVELRGKRVQIVGVDPRSYKRRQSNPERLADPHADLRILLSTIRTWSTGFLRASSTSCFQGTCTVGRSAFRGRAAGCGSHTSAGRTSAASTRVRGARCTSRRGWVRPSFRSASSRGRRRRS